MTGLNETLPAKYGAFTSRRADLSALTGWAGNRGGGVFSCLRRRPFFQFFNRFMPALHISHNARSKIADCFKAHLKSSSFVTRDSDRGNFENAQFIFAEPQKTVEGGFSECS